MSTIADNPYIGSRAFTQADQAFFFGRDADTAAITGFWMTSRLTIVSGPVASGKTSLLHAGVYPAMPVKRPRLLPAGNVSHGMTFPFPALPEHNPFTFALLRSWSPEDLPTRLAGLSISDFVRRFTRGEGGAIYAAIDQLDDLVIGPRHDTRAKWRQRFLAELAQAMTDHPRLHLLLVSRGEALGPLTATVGECAQHAITGLTMRSAVEAATMPAMGAGRSFTEEAASSLVDDLRRTPGSTGPAVADCVEPSLLQAVCRRLWEKLPPSVTEISDWTIREFSDADTALAANCGQVISEVAALHGISSKKLCSWLVNNFATDSGSRGYVHEGPQVTGGQPNAVIWDLLDRHLLTSEGDESARYYRLLTARLIEPLRKASVDHPAAPTAAEYLRAAERDLARGELELAWIHGRLAFWERGNTGTSHLQEQAQAESLLGTAEHRRGKQWEALSHYRKAAELFQATGDTRATAHHLAAVGQILLARGEPTEALPQLRTAVEREPGDLGHQIQLALALWQLGDGRAAIAILNWVLTIDGGHAEARRARGEILADLGEGRSAILDLDPDRTTSSHPSTRAARGLALAELGNHTAAAEEINGALAEARRSGPVLLYAARAIDLAGDKVTMKNWAREAIDATDPPLSRAHKQLALKLAGSRPGSSDVSVQLPRISIFSDINYFS